MDDLFRLPCHLFLNVLDSDLLHSRNDSTSSSFQRMNKTLLSVLRYVMAIVAFAGSLLSLLLIGMESSESGKLAVYAPPLHHIVLSLPTFILLALATGIHIFGLRTRELDVPHRRGALVLKVSWSLLVIALLLMACADSAGTS
jgi:hypothetical protein